MVIANHQNLDGSSDANSNGRCLHLICVVPKQAEHGQLWNIIGALSSFHISKVVDFYEESMTRTACPRSNMKSPVTRYWGEQYATDHLLIHQYNITSPCWWKPLVIQSPDYMQKGYRSPSQPSVMYLPRDYSLVNQHFVSVPSLRGPCGDMEGVLCKFLHHYEPRDSRWNYSVL